MSDPRFSLVAIALVLSIVSNVNSQPVAVDDFYVIDKGQHIDTYLNDPNWAGQIMWTQPAHAGVNTATCPQCLFISPAGDYTGSDSFTYFWQSGPTQSNTARVGLILIGNRDEQNAGSCRMRKVYAPLPPDSKGQPVNVTNGNMWIEHRDYMLPGRGDFIEINRFYNSIIQTTGLFGFGWSTKYDESLQFYDAKMIRYNQADGRAIYFGRLETTDPFFSFSPSVVGQLVPNTDGTYTLTFKDGSSRKFNSNGKLISSSDRNGNVTTLTYNSNGHLTSVTDAAGRTLTLVPNSNGTISQLSDSLGTIADYEYFPDTTLLKTVTFPDGSKYKFEYTTVGTRTLLATVKDALENILETHAYDSEGRAITSEKHGGVERYTFDYTNPNLTTVTDILGRVTKYHHARKYSMNLITKTEGVCGGCGGSGSEVTQFEYDDRLNLVKKIDALNNETLYTYDGDRNIVQEIDPLGTQKWTYNSRGQVLTYKDRVDSQNPDPNVNTVVNTFDANGNLLTTKDALNNTTTLTYTTQGQLATVKDALNHTATLTYDSQGRLTQVKDANNKNTTFGYDARARVTSTTNAVNETTSFEYDPNNRLKKVTYPDTNFVEYTYDLAGRRTVMKDARGNLTNYGYDNAYRVTTVTDPLTHGTTFGYDLMSNLTSQTDSLGNVTNLEYDDFDRLKKVIYPPATQVATRLEESLTYDKLGNVKTRVDTAGRTTAYDYDTSNRLTKITDALNNLTQFEYNLRSQMTKVKDALNQEYIFTYDPLGRVLSQTRAGATMSFEYDSVGNRTERTDYLGRATTYEYDSLNRLKKINYLIDTENPVPGETASYNYDDLSRLASAVNGAGTVSFTYDNRNRLKTETDVFGHVVEYGYDANSNRTQLKLDGNVHTTYAYDAANRLTTLTDDASQNFTYGYDIANRLISKALPNGVSTNYEYDGMSRLTRLKDVNTSVTLFDRQYSYNTANQISQIVDISTTKTFGYDNIDRLTSVTDAVNGNESYAFDAAGNRTSSHLSTSYTYQPFNRVTATQTATLNYDTNGNVTSKAEGSQFWRYMWDHENRLTQAATRKQSVRYSYDALGRRVQRYVRGGSDNTKFTYDGLDVIADDDSGTLTKYQNGSGIDNKLSAKQGTTTNYFLADHLGSTNGLADSTGALTSQTAYDPFGNPTSTLSTRYGFTGRERDDFTGMMYYRARFYDPKVGRFISEDPIGFAGGGVNLYGYVRNRPLIYRDPFGLYPGADVLANPNVMGPLITALAAAGSAIAAGATAAASSPAVVAGTGLMAGYAIGYYPGQWTANHPSNPFVNGPWNPFGNPNPRIPAFPGQPNSVPRGIPPSVSSGPACQSRPRAIPFDWTKPIPSDPPDDREGCAQEISECVQLCDIAEYDPDMKNIWGGNRRKCLEGCISERCKRGLRF